MNHLPRLNRPTSLAKPTDKSIHFSPILAEVAQLERGEVFARMKTSPEGLSEEDAANRWAEVGPNVVAANIHRGWPWRLLAAAASAAPVVARSYVRARSLSSTEGNAQGGHHTRARECEAGKTHRDHRRESGPGVYVVLDYDLQAKRGVME